MYLRFIFSTVVSWQHYEKGNPSELYLKEFDHFSGSLEEREHLFWQLFWQNTSEWLSLWISKINLAGVAVVSGYLRISINEYSNSLKNTFCTMQSYEKDGFSWINFKNCYMPFDTLYFKEHLYVLIWCEEF